MDLFESINDAMLDILSCTESNNCSVKQNVDVDRPVNGKILTTEEMRREIDKNFAKAYRIYERSDAFKTSNQADTYDSDADEYESDGFMISRRPKFKQNHKLRPIAVFLPKIELNGIKSAESCKNEKHTFEYYQKKYFLPQLNQVHKELYKDKSKLNKYIENNLNVLKELYRKSRLVYHRGDYESEEQLFLSKQIKLLSDSSNIFDGDLFKEDTWQDKRDSEKDYIRTVKLFNDGYYVDAYSDFKTLSFIESRNINAIFGCLLTCELVDYAYNTYEEYTEHFKKAFLAVSQNLNYAFLPFFYTVVGDLKSAVDSKRNDSKMYYTLAVNELNLLPETERFSAPYIKLARIYEADKAFDKALCLYESAQRTDQTLNLSDEINRAKACLEGREKENIETAKMYFRKAQSCLDARNFKKALKECICGFKYVPESLYYSILACKCALKAKDYFVLKTAALELNRICNLDDRSEHAALFYYYVSKCLFYEERYNDANSLMDTGFRVNEKFNFNQERINHFAECLNAQHYAVNVIRAQLYFNILNRHPEED